MPGRLSDVQRAVPLLAVGGALAVVLDLATPVGWVPSWLLGLGLTTFAVYGWDKARSKTGGWRVPEVTLHVLALAGGVVGAWAGRAVLRHKTRKREFTVVLSVATVAWVAVLVVTAT